MNAVGAGATVVLNSRGRCFVAGHLSVDVVQFAFAGRQVAVGAQFAVLIVLYMD